MSAGVAACVFRALLLRMASPVKTSVLVMAWQLKPSSPSGRGHRDPAWPEHLGQQLDLPGSTSQQLCLPSWAFAEPPNRAFIK